MNKMTVADLINLKAPFFIPVGECKYMEGTKKAVWDGTTLWVSPAMKSLLTDPNEIEQVAKTIEVVFIPKVDFTNTPILHCGFTEGKRTP